MRLSAGTVPGNWALNVAAIGGHTMIFGSRGVAPDQLPSGPAPASGSGLTSRCVMAGSGHRSERFLAGNRTYRICCCNIWRPSVQSRVRWTTRILARKHQPQSLVYLSRWLAGRTAGADFSSNLGERLAFWRGSPRPLWAANRAFTV